jgi:hypothetical protein
VQESICVNLELSRSFGKVRFINNLLECNFVSTGQMCDPKDEHGIMRNVW